MSVIKFDPIAAFLDDLPDFGDLDMEELEQYRERTAQAIRELDALEPRSQTGEAYEQWAELHEDLEDVLDEILDCMED